MNGHCYDAINNTLTISRAFEKRAKNPNTTEYALYYKFRVDIPDARIIVDEKKVKRDLSLKEMESYIKLCKDAKARLKEFNREKTLAKVQKNPLKHMRHWFHENYANYSDRPEYDKDGYVVVKTKTQMEAEIAVAAERDVSVQSPKDTKNQDLGSEQPCPSAKSRKNPSVKKNAA